jgi:excinuclease ABC subunit A
MREKISEYMSDRPCPSCGGKRLNPAALAVTVDGVNIVEANSWPVLQTLDWARKISGKGSPLTSKQKAIAERVIKEITERLSFLVNVGLDYLTLNRSAVSLSGGEAQRIRLATQVGSRLVGVLYVLDEPSIGLHPRDNARLLETLKGLRDLGNTVLIVCFVVVVIGGIGSIRGALLASLLVGMIDTFGTVLLPQASGVLVYVLMALILLWKPNGLFRAA